MNCGLSDSPLDDEKDRPFICPCGKSYLSYPALFTHIKQKHEGKAPGNVVRPKSQNKRGRPRKMHIMDMNGDGSGERTDYRNLACRMLFNTEEEKELGYLIHQVESAKQRYKANLDFIPPISTSHLALIRAPNATQSKLEHANQPPEDQNSPHFELRKKLKLFFQPLTTSSADASPSEIEALISLNQIYLQSLEEQRKSSRRPLGCDLWEMQLRTALLEFLDCFKDCLNRNQFRNLEIVIGLLIYFYGKELNENKEITTANYIEHLNTCLAKFVTQIALARDYANVYSLRGDRAVRIVLFVHEWMKEEGLTDFAIELNQKYDNLYESSGNEDEKAEN